MCAMKAGAVEFLVAPVDPDALLRAISLLRTRRLAGYPLELPRSERYCKILARNGIQLKVVPSAGSLDNLNRMTDPKSRVDIALIRLLIVMVPY